MAENILTKEVAGLPVGAWAAVVAGGLGLAYLFNKQQADAEEGTREPLVAPDVGTGLVPAGAAFQVGNGQDEEPEYANNLEWGNAAKDYLIGQGHDPTVADNAVRKYLVAEQLTVQENALISLVLVALGPPPEDLPPAPPPEQEPDEPVSRDPDITVDQPYEIQAPYDGRFTISGNVTLGGEPPGSPQLVTFIGYGANFVPFRKFVMETNSAGRFSTSVATWGGEGQARRFVVSYRGEQTAHLLRNT